MKAVKVDVSAALHDMSAAPCNTSGSVFVTAASFLNITAKTGIVNLSEIYYYEILANKHHLNSP